jgi:hypothetical protein
MPAGAAGMAPAMGRLSTGRIWILVLLSRAVIWPQSGPAGEAVPTMVAMTT